MFYESANKELYHNLDQLLDEGVGYQTFGTSGNPPLVLLHGDCGSAYIFDKMLPLLERKNYVVTFDLPGHGSLPEYTQESVFEIACSLNYCKKIIKKLSLVKLNLCGFDIGGSLALLLALETELEIDKLVLINPIIFPGDRCFELSRLCSFPGSDKAMDLEIFKASAAGSGVLWKYSIDLRDKLECMQIPVLEFAAESEPDSDAMYHNWLDTSRAFTRDLDWKIERIYGSRWYIPCEKPIELASGINRFLG